MLNMIILIFVGGAFGAMCREFVMLSVPRLADGFPMDIFVVNIVAAFLLGVATSLCTKRSKAPVSSSATAAATGDAPKTM